MKRILFSVLFMSLAGGLWGWQKEIAADAVVLQVGNFTLTRAEYEKLLLGFDRASGAVTTGANNQSEVSGRDVARLLALTSEAQKRQMDQDPKMQQLIRVRGYTLLSNALLFAIEADVKKDEAGTRAFYATEKHGFVEVKVRHVLVRYKGVTFNTKTAKPPVRTETEAKVLISSLRQKLIQGADFETIVKTNSEDESTNKTGGVLEYFTRGAMAAEFETAAFSLPVNGISDVIKTQNGFHVLQVLDHRPMPFEAVRKALENILARQRYEEIGKTGITLNADYFKK